MYNGTSRKAKRNVFKSLNFNLPSFSPFPDYRLCKIHLHFIRVYNYTLKPLLQRDNIPKDGNTKIDFINYFHTKHADTSITMKSFLGNVLLNSSSLQPLQQKKTASCFANCWESLSIVPAYKNFSEHSDRHIINPLVSSLGKVLKALINAKVFTQITSHSHFGEKTLWLLFRNFYCRCVNGHHNLSVLLFGKNGKIRALALDISKTFERTWHAELPLKLMISSVMG